MRRGGIWLLLERRDQGSRAGYSLLTSVVAARSSDHLPAVFIPPAGLQAKAVRGYDHIHTEHPAARVDAVDHFCAWLVVAHALQHRTLVIRRADTRAGPGARIYSSSMLPSQLFPIMTARLQMRPLRHGDLDALAEIYLHPLVARWIGPHTRQDVACEITQHIANQASLGWSFWAVEDRGSGRLIGDCGLQPLEHHGPEVELGYDLHPSVWGHGLATEAAREVIRQGFGPLGLEHIVAVVKPEHLASQRVLEKVGLRHAGTRAAYGEKMFFYEARNSAPASASGS